MNYLTVPPHYPTGSFTEGKKTYDEGQKVTLKCEPEGSPKPIKIFWKKNGVLYKEKNTPDSNLVFQNLSRIDTGKYTCEAVNDAGTANKIPTTDLVIKCKCLFKILKNVMLHGTWYYIMHYIMQQTFDKNIDMYINMPIFQMIFHEKY